MIPKLLHFIWLGSPLQDNHRKNIETFTNLNPDYQLCIWTEDMLDDLGMDVDWAKGVFPKWAGVSNLARLYVLAKHGGAHFDVDFRCRLPLGNLFPEGATAVAAFQPGGKIICNAFMAAVPNHPWILRQLNHANKYEGYNPEWGPYCATDAPREGLTIIPTRLVYPYSHDAPEQDRHPRSDTVATHLWEGSWTK